MDDKASQLKILIKSGVSIEEAAGALELEVEAAREYLSGEVEKESAAQTPEDYAKSRRVVMLKVLNDIACDITGENIAARVSAAKALAEFGAGGDNQIPIDKLSNYYKKVKELQNKQRESDKQTTTVSQPSPSTTKVDIDMIVKQSNLAIKNN